jgi:hypothetical protein
MCARAAYVGTRASARDAGANACIVITGRELPAKELKAPYFALLRVDDVVVGADKSSIVTIWSLTGEVLRQVETSHAYSILALVRVGPFVCTAGFDKRILLVSEALERIVVMCFSQWDAKTFERKGQLLGHSDSVSALLFVPECVAAPLWSSSVDRTTILWELGV